ncbi:NAD-dependent succinate-semialdehyde dehydrogenase [Bryobacter aggregatus]|uniref:NAD-dependent succinate-semialdehyde dehydrogenase n=1 Tax=Bryobacter aggregatus TaxID=360054 RepID=UPI0004E18CAD|nr:NAD-dependent succinate-semialdehyde dehydrogenase [Bryobacter aggregatus]
MPIETINPATGERLKSFPALDAEQIEEKLHLAHTVFSSWKNSSFAERKMAMQKAAAILRNEAEELGALITREMGKTLQSAIAEVEKCASACLYYAENAEAMLMPKEVASAAAQSFVQYRPIGPVLAVMPWNFPFWQVFRFAAPALMAGNVGLLKHAANVPQSALAIEDVLLRAGFPEGVFQTLLIGSDQVEGILRDPRVAAATLTGSEGAGRAVAAIAGDAVKKTVLELGGSDPFLVMASADPERTARMAVQARCINNGQSCIAAKRFIVEDSIFQAFSPRFVEKMAALRVGDPMLPDTELGPLATAKLLDELHVQVQAAIAAGATLLTGGHRIEGPGNYYAPTVLADLPPDAAIAKEEFFGPVALLFRAHDAMHALRLANNSPFGLSASVWTEDALERDFFIRNLESGLVFINANSASDPKLPFGGIKRSGYGRELSELGMYEFCNIQTVWITEPASTSTRSRSHQSLLN